MRYWCTCACSACHVRVLKAPFLEYVLFQRCTHATDTDGNGNGEGIGILMVLGVRRAIAVELVIGLATRMWAQMGRGLCVYLCVCLRVYLCVCVCVHVFVGFMCNVCSVFVTMCPVHVVHHCTLTAKAPMKRDVLYVLWLWGHFQRP